MKIISTVLLVLFCTTIGLAQENRTVNKSVNDDGKNLTIHIEIKKGDEQLHVNRTYAITGMSEKEKTAILETLYDSLGINDKKNTGVKSSNASEKSMSAAGTRELIEKLNHEMEDAFNKNDMAKVAEFYSADAQIWSGNYVVTGKADIEKYWLVLKDKGRGWKLDITEIGGQGDYAYQLGRSDLLYISNSKEQRSVTNFVLVWKKQPGGTYKIFRDYLTKTEFSKPTNLTR